MPNGVVPNGLVPNSPGNGKLERAEMGAKRPISASDLKDGNSVTCARWLPIITFGCKNSAKQFFMPYKQTFIGFFYFAPEMIDTKWL